jgi:hypothetical protein
MRKTLAIATMMLVSTSAALLAQDASRSVAGGGITAQGWAGKVDPNEEKQGKTINDAKFTWEKDSNSYHVVTGPATTYWNPGNTAVGNYTVKASFKEPKFMNLNSHPHPYGIFIGGNDMGTDKQTFLYCEAYGNGRFVMRGFNPAPFALNGRGEQSDAVNKAAGPGEPVAQEIAVSVKGDKIECSVNGKVVGTYDRSAAVGEGKAKSTDGVYGVRFAHNTEGFVSGLTMSKQ